MEGLFSVIMLGGAIGTATYYWFTRGRYEENFLLARLKTMFAFFFWYLMVIWLVVEHKQATERQTVTDQARKRILG